jgi:RNA polymerase sigma factor (TIGR02999 family)
MDDFSRILEDVERGDPDAPDRLLGVVYEELHRLAGRKLEWERPDHTLQATDLVHEAYLRLAGDDTSRWENSAHFFGAAAEAMRRILIESARRKARLKHGGGRKRQDLDEHDAVVFDESIDLLALDEVLERLQTIDPVKADLVKLRYFAGLTVEQAGRVMGISRATADRYWTFARTWLFREMSKGETRT